MSAEWHSSWLLVLVSSSVSPSSIPSLSGTQASVGAAAVKSGNFWSQLSRFPPSLSVPSLCTYLASQPMNIMKREYLPSPADTSWITFHRKLYHPEFPCNNPEEKLPICRFRPITPLRLVVLRLLHAHYFELRCRWQFERTRLRVPKTIYAWSIFLEKLRSKTPEKFFRS